MKKNFKDLQTAFSEEIVKVKTVQEFEAIRIKYLSKKGVIQELYASMPQIDPKDRPTFGKEVNDLRQYVEKKIGELKTQFEKKKSKEVLDFTLPGRMPFVGRKHPLTQVLDEVKRFFLRLTCPRLFGSSAKATALCRGCCPGRPWPHSRNFSASRSFAQILLDL